ncbi:MAG: D-amino-acid transaminase [Gammaproteobacteria bacterium]|nr:D-amino-acid transaminase [Gammaproteobacteria bacterium]
MSIVYLNGDFLPIEQAHVSVLDRGFLLGDGIYEVIPAYGGRLFRLTEHLQRLDNSLAAIQLSNPKTSNEWQDMLEDLVQRNGVHDQSIYIQITRGVASKREHHFPDNVIATVFAMSNPIHIPELDLQQGYKAITHEDIRWKYCNIKAITLLPNVLLRQKAVEADAAEAILIRNGKATEGAASNLFIVRDKQLITPPKGGYILPGITRDLIVELASHHNIPLCEKDISEQDLRHADEIWMSSSTREIIPITQLDDQFVGDGKPGPLFRHMAALYHDCREALRNGEKNQ